MKRILLAAWFCAASLAGRAQVPGEEPFHGGAADGHSRAEAIVFIGSSLSFSPYVGGAGDGYDGGDAASNVDLPYANNFSPFIGGVGDGYASALPPTNVTFPYAVNFSPFLGGVADGYAGLLIPNVTIGVPLGLEALAFEGRAVAVGHLLFWNTVGEKSLAHFGLERSADGRAFGPLAQVKAKGGASRTEYDYIDAQPLAGHNYYRLKLQDADGTHRYSSVVLLIRESAAGPSLVIFPNPARHTLRLQHERLPEGTVARVVDARGGIVWSTAMTAGNNAIDLPVDRWVPGTYLLHLAAPNGWHEEVRFVKQ